MRIRVAELTDWPSEISAGRELLSSIRDSVLGGRPVEIDFTGCRHVTGTFLRYAFSELFRSINLLKFRELVRIVAYPSAETHILERVLSHLAETMYAESMRLRRAPAA